MSCKQWRFIWTESFVWMRWKSCRFLAALWESHSSFSTGSWGFSPGASLILGFPKTHSALWISLCLFVALVVKNPPASARDVREAGSIHRGFSSWVGKILWRKTWQPTPVFLPGESPHGQRSLAGYSPQGHRHDWATKHIADISTQHLMVVY